MELTREQKALDGLWELARKGNQLAIENLINFIIVKGRTFLICFVRRPAGGARTGYTTDVIQETAIRVWKQASQGKLKPPKGNALHTLGTFVANIAREAFRLKKMIATKKPLTRVGLSTLEDTMFLQAAEHFDPARLVPDYEEHLRHLGLLHDSLSKLSDQDQEILKSRMDGKTEVEIAQDLGISHDAARQRYHRALQAMATHFKRLLLEPSSNRR
jgi:RNA polymerase sigma factor (sigma-70 family)